MLGWRFLLIIITELNKSDMNGIFALHNLLYALFQELNLVIHKFFETIYPTMSFEMILSNVSKIIWSLLWNECLCPSKMRCWSLNLQCEGFGRQSLWKVIRSRGWNSREWEQCPYKKRHKNMITPSPPCAGTMRKRLSANQEVGPQQIPDLSVPWSWTSQTPELWEINFCCLWSIQSTVFCYSTIDWTNTVLFQVFFL